VSGIEWFDFALLTGSHLDFNGLFAQRITLKQKMRIEGLAEACKVLFTPVVIKECSRLL